MTPRGTVRARWQFHQHRWFNDEEPWLGPVERVAELTAERRVALGLEPVERRKSVVEFWLCQNPYCRQFTPRGSRAAGMCLICFTPKPAHV